MSSTILKKKQTVQKTLKPSDICRIIETCKTSGVRDFQMGSLHIKFGESFPEPKESWSEFTAKQANTSTQTGKAPHQSARKLSEEDASRMLLEDPAEYERYILSGELDNAEL